MVQNSGQREQQNKNGHWTAKSDKTVSKIGGAGKLLLCANGGHLECDPGKDKNGKKSWTVQEAVYGPPMQPRWRVR